MVEKASLLAQDAGRAIEKYYNDGHQIAHPIKMIKECVAHILDHREGNKNDIYPKEVTEYVMNFIREVMIRQGVAAYEREIRKLHRGRANGTIPDPTKPKTVGDFPLYI